MEGNITTQTTISGGLSAEENMTGELSPVGSIKGNITLPPYIPTGSSNYNELDNKPSINGHTLEGDQTSEELGIHIPENVSELANDKNYITAEDIPPTVTDLGEIDGDQYEWDVEVYLNTLQETGSYVFLWDEFKYFVDIKAVEVDETTTVQQVYWGTEEGGGTVYYRNVVVENGEIVRADITNYMTFGEANTAFARITHTHVRLGMQAQLIWDYCNTVAMQNANPIVIYFDTSTNKTYVIETYVGNGQPVYKLQRVTNMNNTSCFYQRSSYYYSGREHWGDWYKFSGEAFAPSK